MNGSGKGNVFIYLFNLVYLELKSTVWNCEEEWWVRRRMAKSENCEVGNKKMGGSSCVQCSSAKVHPSNDPELDPDSYALEKFRLYETRAVPFPFHHSIGKENNLKNALNNIFIKLNWICLFHSLFASSDSTWSGVIGTRGSSGCWKSIDQSRPIWISVKTLSCIPRRKSRACFSGLPKATGPPAASLSSPRFTELPVSL